MLARTKVATCIFLALAVTAAAPAQATLLDFDLAWSGASFGNTATATGSITIDDTVLPNPAGCCVTGVAPVGITAFSITVTGATSGNGTFDLADFTSFIWHTNVGTLDLSQELVGQAIPGGTWGTLGDFNIFAISNPSAPLGRSTFTFGTNGGTGDLLRLTSFAPAAVPAPAALALFGVGVAGIGAVRRRRAA